MSTSISNVYFSIYRLPMTSLYTSAQNPPTSTSHKIKCMCQFDHKSVFGPAPENPGTTLIVPNHQSNMKIGTSRGRTQNPQRYSCTEQNSKKNTNKKVTFNTQHDYSPEMLNHQQSTNNTLPTSHQQQQQ